MKKPDRFERAATKEQLYTKLGNTHVLRKDDVVTLLRRQHNAYVRLVKGIEQDVHKVKKIVGNGDLHAQGMLDGAQCVLAALARYRKVKP